GMAVDEMLNLKNVDLASGNIDFDGTVIVDKDVAEDMRVIATGDICIGGLVESSHLQAGGSVFIGKGIIGRQIQESKDSKDSKKEPEPVQYAMVILAGGDIRSTYAQSAELNSGGSVYIQKYLYHSRVEAADSLWVGSDKIANGKLIGGEISVGAAVQAGTIGMPSAVPINIDLSSRIRDSKERQDGLRRELDLAAESESKLANLLTSLWKRGLHLTAEKLQRLKDTHAEDQRRVAVLQTDMRQLEAEQAQLIAEIKVVARKTLHPGVILRLLDKVERVGRDHNAVEVRVTENLGLEIRPIRSAQRRQGKISKTIKHEDQE
ncbi:MAG: DUF342 domain-containing protein, partial [Gammaproteobacteria bacterium]|nr:DUF342 domain-containing protein [Gammaproteobacteria bacterium]